MNGFVFWNVNKCIPHRRVVRKTRAVVPVPLTKAGERIGQSGRIGKLFTMIFG